MVDCSTDNSPEIIKSFDENRIEYHRWAVRRGYPYFDDMIPFIRGRFFIQRAHNDIWMPDRLEVLVSCAVKDESLDVVYDDAGLIDKDGKPVRN